jgi:hypothetical protein
MKNGKITGHTDNYIQVQVKTESNFLNTIQDVKLIDNHSTFVVGDIV